MSTQTPTPSTSAEAGPRPSDPIEPLAERAEPPVASLTVYRALAACHIAGAVLSILGMVGAASSVVGPLRLPLTILAVAQLILAVTLLRRPTWIPALILRWPQLTWATSVSLALLIGGAAISYAPFPFTLSAACWVSTAAAVGPRRSWPLLGVGLSAGCAALWLLYGQWDLEISEESEAIGAVQLAMVFVNAAWMGAAGNAAAWRLRRWGLIVAADDGALDRLRQAGAAVRDAASNVLERTSDVRTANEAIAAKQLGAATATAAADAPGDALIEELLRDLRVPFTVTPRCDPDVEVMPEQWAVVRPALLRHFTNVVRHAPAATEVVVELTAAGGRAGASTAASTSVVIACEDDGGQPAPAPADEGAGSQLSRDALHEVDGTLRYLDGAAGVRLELALPAGGDADADPPPLGLGAEVRAFADLALRNNRLVSWIAPVPPMIWAFDAPWIAVATLLLAGLACELTIRRMGPSGPGKGPLLPLLFIGFTAVVLTAVLAITVTNTWVYPAAAATAYPIIEIAWRHRWGLWALFEVARGIAILPWVLEFGGASISAAYLFPLAATLIVLGAERLVRRGDELDRRVGGAVAWRQLALDAARDAALRHDVVDRLRGTPGDAELDQRLAQLDAATDELASMQIALSDPVADSLAVARASLEPVPLRVVHEEGAGAGAGAGAATSTIDAFTAFGLLRRLDRLEAVADATVELVETSAPSWHGSRQLRSVDASVRYGESGELRLTLTPIPSGTPVEISL